MDFDFSGLKADIANMDRAFALAAEGNGRAFVYTEIFAPSLAQKIGEHLKPYLSGLTPDSPQALRDDMEFLYSRMIAYRPFEAFRHVVKGQFYYASAQFEKATDCFREAHRIDTDPARKWPHLQPTERHSSLLLYLGSCLCKTGQEEQGQKFIRAGQDMIQKLKAEPTDRKHSPKP